MKMQNWLNVRCGQLLNELNKVPFTDDCEEKKMQLIMSAMRESSIEMFQRAAEKSRKQIEKINNHAVQDAIHEVEASMSEEVEKETVPVETPAPKVPEAAEVKKEKIGPKIKLSSSVIRRADSF